MMIELRSDSDISSTHSLILQTNRPVGKRSLLGVT